MRERGDRSLGPAILLRAPPGAHSRPPGECPQRPDRPTVPVGSIRTMHSPGIPLLRVVVAGAQAATIALTWPLWQVRTSPPHLPWLDVPQMPFGALLLASLALAVWRPIAGVLVHTILLALAIASDQLREQPQVFSLALLLAATVPVRGAATIGALHVAALWFWSGLGKLGSERFLHDGGAWLLAHSPAHATWLAPATAAALGAGELLLAVGVLMPRTRRLAAWTGGLAHLAVLGYLSPLGRDTNAAVWPWNVALALAAPVLFANRSGALIGPRADEGLLPRGAAVLFVLLPLGYRAGFVDAAFAQQVYVMNEPIGTWLRADGRVERIGLVPDLQVFVPPVPRVYEAWFQRTKQRGDQLVITEPRPWARWFGAHDRLLGKDRKEAP